MRSGELDRQITIQTRSETRGGAGGVTENWTDLATVPASVRQRQGGEDTDAAQQHDDQVYVFKIRFRTDVTSATERIKYKSETYDIRGVKELGRREALQIEARRNWQ